MGAVKQVFRDIKTYWEKPKEGNYISFKEMKNYIIGCMGVSGVNNALSYIGWAVTCPLIGHIYGLKFEDLYYITLINLPFSYIFQPIWMVIQDNIGNVPKKTMRGIHAVLIPLIILGTALFFVPQELFDWLMPAFPQLVGTIMVQNAVSAYIRKFIFQKFGKKYGKFRSWIIAGILPAMVILFLIVWLPFKDMPYHTRLWLLHFCFANFYIFTQFKDQQDNIRNVITPNNQERTILTSVKEVLAAAGGGIVLLAIPIVAQLTGGLLELNTYRYIVPIAVLLFAPLVLFQAFGVKDRVILEEKHETNVNMFNGFKEVIRNKYLWIMNISNILGAISWGSVALLNVFFIYSLRQDWLLGVVVAITGIPGGLIASFMLPWLVKRFGKRNTVLFSRLLYYSWFFLAYLAIQTDNAAMMMIGFVLNGIFGTTTGMMQGIMTPDIWDYQQYISGKRLEGCTGIFGLLVNPVTLVLSMTVPAVYSAVGFTNDWDILFIPHLRQEVFMWTLILLFIGHTGGSLPFLFYDLSEKKHAEIIEVLKRRKEELDAIV